MDGYICRFVAVCVLLFVNVSNQSCHFIMVDQFIKNVQFVVLNK